MQYGTDGMGKYYTYQMHNNEIEKYIVEQIYEPEKRCGDCMIRSKLKKIYEFSFNNMTDTISSVVADTVMEMMKNDLLLASYQSDGKVLAPDNACRAYPARNARTLHRRTVIYRLPPQRPSSL